VLLLGRGIVSSAKDYRKFADECFGWAGTANTDKQRRIFLQMAEAWLGAAAQAEAFSRKPNGRPRELDGPVSTIEDGGDHDRDPGRFPVPWMAEEHDAFFIVRDRNYRTLAYRHFEREIIRRTTANLLTRAEARRIAAHLAKLPELLRW
jgi:hypothetical protein